jgi:hypothetical protein
MGTSGIIVGTATLVGSALIFTGGITVLEHNPTDTHLQFKNNGHSWDHISASLSNSNSPNVIYLDMWIKPGDNVTLDLSKALGYSDQQVPPGTQFTYSAYENILSTNTGNPDNLNLDVKGYSGNAQQSANIFNSQFPGIPVQQLPTGVTDSKITYSSSPSDGQNFFNGIIAGDGSIYEQETFTINNDGTVTINTLTSPVLCKITSLNF